ncbi:MAG TPA: hypothetical protein VMT00_15560 [Thermoanaerobaculia bacterium]|nr:hypothetical protein [Thermoanaerobaculia bacterium]
MNETRSLRSALLRLHLPPLIVALFVWGVLFGPGLFRYSLNLENDLLFTDDARQQIWPMFPDDASGFKKDDVIRSYYRQAFLPIVYRAFYWTSSPLIDPATLSKFLPLLLLLILILFCARASKHAGGYVTMAATGVLVLASSVPLGVMAGGLPRAFALPLFALGALGAVEGRLHILALATALAAGFYPSHALPLGMSLAAFLLFRGPLQIDSVRSGRKAILVAASAFVLSALLVTPLLLAGRQYGGRITRGEIESYPEAGPNGRYHADDHPPFSGTLSQILRHSRRAFLNPGPPFLPPLRSTEKGAVATAGSLFAICLAGIFVAWKKNPALRRIGALMACIALSHALAVAGWPWLFSPERHVRSALPVLLWILLPVSAAALAQRLAGGSRGVMHAATIGVTAASVLLLGGTTDPKAGLSVEVVSPEVYEFVATLPAGSMVAGFPNGIVDNVPYIARRSALVTLETHQALYRGYTLEMRRRTNALVDACFAVDRTPILALRRDFGVTHLIVEESHFGEQPPWYFEPFTRRVRDAHALGRLHGFALEKLTHREVVFRSAGVAVVDLAMLE